MPTKRRVSTPCWTSGSRAPAPSRRAHGSPRQSRSRLGVGRGAGARGRARSGAAHRARAGRPRRGDSTPGALCRESGVPALPAGRPCAFALIRVTTVTTPPVADAQLYHFFLNFLPLRDGTTLGGGVARPAVGAVAGRHELSSAPRCVVSGGGFDACGSEARRQPRADPCAARVPENRFGTAPVLDDRRPPARCA